MYKWIWCRRVSIFSDISLSVTDVSIRVASAIAGLRCPRINDWKQTDTEIGMVLISPREQVPHNLSFSSKMTLGHSYWFHANRYTRRASLRTRKLRWLRKLRRVCSVAPIVIAPRFIETSGLPMYLEYLWRPYYSQLGGQSSPESPRVTAARIYTSHARHAIARTRTHKTWARFPRCAKLLIIWKRKSGAFECSWIPSTRHFDEKPRESFRAEIPRVLRSLRNVHRRTSCAVVIWNIVKMQLFIVSLRPLFVT